MAAVLQGEIDMGYRRFVGLVATSRHQTPEAIDKIAQGRVWDGTTALHNGLVDELGGFDQALAWVAKRAGTNAWHPVYLADAPDGFSGLLQAALSGDNNDDSQDASVGQDLASSVAMAQSALAGQMAGDLDRLLGGQGAQAYCLVCAGLVPPVDTGAPIAKAHLPWLMTVLGLVR